MFFCGNALPKSKARAHLKQKRSKVALIKYLVDQNVCNTSFHGILTCNSFYGIISVIQGNLQGQRVNF